jgi:hypothetical protein
VGFYALLSVAAPDGLSATLGWNAAMFRPSSMPTTSRGNRARRPT